jgi:hypothetical protein
MNDVRAANGDNQLAVRREGNAAKIIPRHRFGHLTDLILRFNRRDRLVHRVGCCKAFDCQRVVSKPGANQSAGLDNIRETTTRWRGTFSHKFEVAVNLCFCPPILS